MRAAILLASHAGLRRGDTLRVAPIHYNAEPRTITIEQQKTGAILTVPVSDALAHNLERAPTGDPQTPFLQLYAGRPVTKNKIARAWTSLKRKAQVNPELTMHDLRRTLAVSLYEVSKDLRIVEQMLGHQSLRSTAEYLEHRDPAKLRPYIASLFTPKGPVQ